MPITPELWEMIVRMTAALLAGVILGVEREWKGKPAGLKTLSLVSIGAATFAMLTLYLVDELAELHGVSMDPVRMVAGLIGGIGFLGAGAIIQSRGSVTGVTTAGAIWLTGAVGLACGTGYFLLAAFAVGGALIVLRGLWFLEKALVRKHSPADPDGVPEDEGS